MRLIPWYIPSNILFYRYDWIENKLAHIGRLDNSMFSSDSRWTKASVISEELLEHPLVGWVSLIASQCSLKMLTIPIFKPIVAQIIFTCVPFIERIMKRRDRVGYVRGRSKTEWFKKCTVVNTNFCNLCWEISEPPDLVSYSRNLNLAQTN